MKGYWHIAAGSGLAAAFGAGQDNYWPVAVYLLWVFYLHLRGRIGRLPTAIALVSMAFFLVYLPSPQGLPDTKDIPASPYIGEIASAITVTESRLEFLFREAEAGSLVSVTQFNRSPTDGLPSEIRYGASCVIAGNMEIPSPSSNPGQFDYANYLYSNGISYQLLINSSEAIRCEGGSGVAAALLHFRHTLLQLVTDNLGDNMAAWTSALVLGDDSLIPEETVKLFQRWSLSHVLAISGLHVGLLASFIYMFFVKLNITTKEKAEWSLLIFFPFYVLMAGGEPSVLRASMMICTLVLLRKIGWKLHTADILSIAFILLILWDRYVIYHVGFQLSFAVTFSLILSAGWFSQSESRYFQILNISVVAQLMILPLLFTYFNYFQPLSILLNSLIVPYFSLFVIPFSFLSFLLIPLPNSVVHKIDACFSWLHFHMLDLIHWVDNQASFPLVMGEWPLWLMVAYYVTLILFMMGIELGKKKEAVIYSCCLVSVILYPALQPYFSPEGKITMLDVGQAEAIIVELPYRRGVFMVDAGSHFSYSDMEASDHVFERVIKPYLYSHGIQKLDAVIVTHEDTDHSGSLDFMMDQIKMEQVITSPFYVVEEGTLSIWQRKGIDHTMAKGGDTIRIGGQTLHILAPIEDRGSVNQNSLVFYTQVGGKSWLFTGDITAEEEKEMLKRYLLLKADVLKVAHHGSNTSTSMEFAVQIAPEYALISVGRDNRYGHPAPDVIDTLSQTTVLRTDTHGAIQFRFHGKRGTFYRYLP
ncbi:DNA internalization-related competence protein ComEC/Rec2 [Virgibacillus sediminis]|uniref:DNA internalization-related competence protein ComEC/Rec2 n=1 Tax=Virgibacillus sediminis TaxID=202260 RepID=A0ABV7A5R9_9BACI